MSKRLACIDIAKGIAIIFIVFGHSLVYTPNAYMIYKYIYSFHVVLFFILSGFTYNDKKSVKLFVNDKFKSLMVPYFVFAVLFLIPYLLLGNYTSFDAEIPNISQMNSLMFEILYGNGNDFALKQNTSLWFLPALFSSEVIYRCLDEIKFKHKDIVLTLGLLSISCLSTYMQIVLPWGINTALGLLVFFQLGILIRKYKVIEKINMNVALKMILILLSISTLHIYKINVTVDCVDYGYGTYYIFLFTSIVVPVFIIWISYLIGNCTLLEYIGKNTLSILIFHKIFLILFQINYSFMPNFLRSANLWISMPMAIFVTAVTIAITLGIGYIINRFFPLLYGKRKRVLIEK